MDTFQSIATIIAGTTAALAGMFSVVAVVVLLRYKTETLEKTEHALKLEFKELRDKVTGFMTLIESRDAAQQIMNQFEAKNFEYLAHKLETLENEVKKWRS